MNIKRFSTNHILFAVMIPKVCFFFMRFTQRDREEKFVEQQDQEVIKETTELGPVKERSL